MHAINSMFGAGAASILTASQNQAAQSYGPILQADRGLVMAKSTTIFNGRIQVDKVANGYVINIATREGYEYETYIASTIQEVNERIAASMVSFQLEGK